MSCSATFIAAILSIFHLCSIAASSPVPSKADILHRHEILPRSVSEPSIYPTRFKGTTWDNSNWIINTTVLTPGIYQSRMSSANGYMGISVAAAGPFFEYDIPVDGDNIEGWPLFTRRQAFATLSGFFDEQPTTNGTNYPWLQALGGESVISGIPHWGGILVVLENGQVLNATVDPATITNFSSLLDFKQGLSMWQYTWTPRTVMECPSIFSTPF
jgi:trehalose/maltose hydrolase-like predicted phosphorylase